MGVDKPKITGPLLDDVFAAGGKAEDGIYWDGQPIRGTAPDNEEHAEQETPDNETLLLAMLTAREQAGDDSALSKAVMRAILSEHAHGIASGDAVHRQEMVEDKTGHEHDAGGLFTSKGGGGSSTSKKKQDWHARNEKRTHERAALDRVEKSLLEGEELPAKREMQKAKHPGHFISAAGRYAGELKARVAAISAALVAGNAKPLNERMDDHEEKINAALDRVKERKVKAEELEADLYDLPEDSPKIERAEQRLASATEKVESAMMGVEKALTRADDDIHKMGLKLIADEHRGIDDEEADDEEPEEEETPEEDEGEEDEDE